MANTKLGKQHTDFMRWAKSQGVKINGVTPAHVPGRGSGMIATRNIEEGEVMITVPLDLMITIDSIPASFIKQFPTGTSIHGILAAFLTEGDHEFLKRWDLWRRVWPSRKDFEDSMPILWPANLRRSNSEFQQTPCERPFLLPPSASGIWNSFETSQKGRKFESKSQNLLAQQEKRLQDAWRNVLTVFPNMDWDKFSFHWLILNTRSFYYVKPGQEPPEDWNDAIGLVPFADYFNHSDDADCEVVFDGAKYTFTASRRYVKGEEIFMSYGAHSNDFLFVEYGFFLDQNESDVIFLDDIISNNLSEAEKEELASQQGLGDYQVTPSGVCPRTINAACVKYMPSKDFRNYVQGRATKAFDTRKTWKIIREWIETYLRESNTTIEALESLTTQREGQVGHQNKVASLRRRWEQIRVMCQNALDKINAAQLEA
ncbi:SET domain protein [Aspergillus udagawae]|uniref:SET domain protein n=1 Tax=Aspergillus udagawae TaxID=91492 RepID=A0A8H3S7K7_9EURO|nr:SET domain protein [Aspergillus udagawae]